MVQDNKVKHRAMEIIVEIIQARAKYKQPSKICVYDVIKYFQKKVVHTVIHSSSV